MKALLHICCAPCAIYPVKSIRTEGLDVMGFFYRHNIHPYSECLRRQETLQAYSEKIDLRVIIQDGVVQGKHGRGWMHRETVRSPTLSLERHALVLAAWHGSEQSKDQL